MQKRTMRSRARSHHVDLIHPAKGYIDIGSGEDDLIQNAGNASYAECCEELRTLATEKAKAENMMIVAKRGGDPAAIRQIGHRISAYCQRAAAFRNRRAQLERDFGHVSLKDAMREALPPDVCQSIFERSNELEEEYRARGARR